MSKRTDRSWVVFLSIEILEHDRRVDLYFRPDGSFGFEAFRRDAANAGVWIPIQFYSGPNYGSFDDLYDAAVKAVTWLGDRKRSEPELKGRVARASDRYQGRAAYLSVPTASAIEANPSRASSASSSRRTRATSPSPS